METWSLRRGHGEAEAVSAPCAGVQPESGDTIDWAAAVSLATDHRWIGALVDLSGSLSSSLPDQFGRGLEECGEHKPTWSTSRRLGGTAEARRERRGGRGGHSESRTTGGARGVSEAANTRLKKFTNVRIELLKTVHFNEDGRLRSKHTS